MIRFEYGKSRKSVAIAGQCSRSAKGHTSCAGDYLTQRSPRWEAIPGCPSAAGATQTLRCFAAACATRSVHSTFIRCHGLPANSRGAFRLCYALRTRRTRRCARRQNREKREDDKRRYPHVEGSDRPLIDSVHLARADSVYEDGNVMCVHGGDASSTVQRLSVVVCAGVMPVGQGSREDQINSPEWRSPHTLGWVAERVPCDEGSRDPACAPPSETIRTLLAANAENSSSMGSPPARGQGAGASGAGSGVTRVGRASSLA